MKITTIAIADQAKHVVRDYAYRYDHLRPLMVEIGEEYIKRVDNRFVSQSDPDGKPWQPTRVLSNYLGFVGTRAGYRRKQAYTKTGGFRVAFARYLENKKILQLTGALRGDIHYQADDGSVTIGTSGRIPYAGIHQFGGMAGRGHKVRIPARPYLARNVGGIMEMGAADQEMVVGKAADYLNQP
jgi:phage gpG-like protein